MGTMRLRVELFYDDEVGQWGYSVPALSILGTGCDSRAAAERFAIEAIELAIESADEDIDDGADVMTLDVQVARAV